MDDGQDKKVIEVVVMPRPGGGQWKKEVSIVMAGCHREYGRYTIKFGWTDHWLYPTGLSAVWLTNVYDPSTGPFEDFEISYPGYIVAPSKAVQIENMDYPVLPRDSMADVLLSPTRSGKPMLDLIAMNHSGLLSEVIVGYEEFIRDVTPVMRARLKSLHEE